MLATRFACKTFVQSRTPLTDDQIRMAAPSIFAQSAHDSRSDRYTYVPTVDVLNGLRGEGFLPFMAGQSRCRIEGKSEYTKHMLRLRRAGDITGESVPEVIMINSHDGTSSYQMLAGMFRFVCMNGMVCGDVSSDVRVRHKGDIVGDVIDGAYSVVKEFDRVADSAERMKAISLSPGEQDAFARAALVAKYSEESEIKAFPVTEAQVLQPRRHDDAANDLWRTFNRVQENIIRGGLRGRSASGRRTRTREVQGITQNVQLNRALWTLADEMARLKAA